MGPLAFFAKYQKDGEAHDSPGMAPLTPANPGPVRRQLLRSCSAPAGLLAAGPVEPLLMQPAGPLSSQSRLALGWPCQPNSIWSVRNKKKWNQRGGCYRTWRYRKWHRRPTFPYLPQRGATDESHEHEVTVEETQSSPADEATLSSIAEDETLFWDSTAETWPALST